MIKNIATLLAAASLGIVSLGMSACDDDGTADKPPAPSAPATSPAPGGSPAGTAAVSSSPGTSSPSASASSKDPVVTGSQVIMIDPDGKKYTRKEMVQLAAGMAAAFQGRGLPSNFCAMSYKQGVDEGGKFPAGRWAFMEACQEGVKLAS